jgi:hypothetical protein
MMTLDEKRRMVLDFLSAQRFAVVASIWNGLPQAAVVAFTGGDSFELMFGTLDYTRKYRNLTADPRVALVIGWDEAVTVQYEGTAVELTGDEREEWQQRHLRKHPGSSRYASIATQRYIKTIPRWIRYTDISQDPEFVFELKFE